VTDDTSSDLVLHHYDPSPYSEKARLVFGLKGLAWRSVIVPMVLPKPLLLPLTGGFRRTPVLQIGADIYCDTLRIAMELDRRHPDPPVLPDPGMGFDNILATWAERVLMWPTARYVTGMNREALSAPFFADRSAMRGHATPSMAEVEASLPHHERQLHLMLGWIEDVLADGRNHPSGERPRLSDFAVYQRLWWLKALEGKAAQALDLYPRIQAWMSRVAEIGHGKRTELTPDEALAIGKDATPAPIPAEIEADGPAPGTFVAVATEDFAPDPVQGTVVYATRDEIAIRRDDPRTGVLHVHFPRLGYDVTAL
jgi:glutathione S-transferase